MNIQSIISQIRNLLGQSAGAEVSFGNPAQVGDLSIIPVARIAFGFGGGGGKGTANVRCKKTEPATPGEEPAEPTEPCADKSAEDSFGGGVGGGIKTDPLGIYTIKNDKVRFYPVISVRDILAAVAILGVLVIRIKRLQKKVKK